MGRALTILQSIDAVDLTITMGVGCVVVGVALRYDIPLAVIVFGVSLLVAGGMALWRRR